MGKRLLVTDDAMIIREMIKDAALDNGWEIAGEAANGQEAIDQFAALQPDAMTLDLVMPEYDGLYALKGVIEQFPDAKILVVSAIDQTDVLKDALRLGATDFIVKPFDKSRLLDALEKIVTSNETAAAG
jgi:two-component system chemotaxis response regulator CheY